MTLSLTRKKKLDRGSVGLDLDSGFVAAVALDGRRIVRTASRELPEGAMRDGEVGDPQTLSSALKEFASESGLPRQVRLGVANQQIVMRVIELPQIENQDELDAAVRFQAAEAIAMPLDEAVLDHQVIGFGEAPDGGKRMRVVVVAARQGMVELLVETVRSAGLKPTGLDLDAFALVRVLAGENGSAQGGEPVTQGARVFCHLGGVTNLAVTVGDICFFTRPLASRWQGELAASELADEVRLSIDYYMAQPGAHPVAEVVVSGPGARDEELVGELGRHVGLPTVAADPLRGLELDGVAVDGDSYRYTVAAGLALGVAA